MRKKGAPHNPPPSDPKNPLPPTHAEYRELLAECRAELAALKAAKSVDPKEIDDLKAQIAALKNMLKPEVPPAPPAPAISPPPATVPWLF